MDVNVFRFSLSLSLSLCVCFFVLRDEKERKTKQENKKEKSSIKSEWKMSARTLFESDDTMKKNIKQNMANKKRITEKWPKSFPI